jgi:hypothetical protein
VTTACALAGLPPKLQRESMVVETSDFFHRAIGTGGSRKRTGARLQHLVGRGIDALLDRKCARVALDAGLDLPQARLARGQFGGLGGYRRD